MNNRDQAIKDVAEAMGRSPGRLGYAIKNGGLGVKAKELAYAVSQRERVLGLEAAIRWALGCEQADGSDFRERRPGEGAYWWRNELEARANLAASAPEKENL